MLKKFALITLLLGCMSAPLAWGQDEYDSDDDDVQVDDESASAADESADEGDYVDQGSDEDAEPGESADAENTSAEDAPDDASDEGDTADESGDDGEASDEDASGETADSEDPTEDSTTDTDAAGGSIGTLVTYNADWGYGFIETDDGSEIYVDAADVSGEVKQGDRVRFEMFDGTMSDFAVNVRPESD